MASECCGSAPSSLTVARCSTSWRRRFRVRRHFNPEDSQSLPGRPDDSQSIRDRPAPVPSQGRRPSRAPAPCGQQSQEVRHADHSISVEVGRVAGVGTPGGEQAEQILYSHAAIAVEIERTALAQSKIHQMGGAGVEASSNRTSDDGIVVDGGRGSQRSSLLAPVPQQDQQVDDADRAIGIEVCRAIAAV